MPDAARLATPILFAVLNMKVLNILSRLSGFLTTMILPLHLVKILAWKQNSSTTYLGLMIPGKTSHDRLSVIELPLEVVMTMTTAENPLSGFLEQGTTSSLIRGKANYLTHTFVVPVDAGYTDGFLTPAALRPCVPDAVVVFSSDIRKNGPGEPKPILRG